MRAFVFQSDIQLERFYSLRYHLFLNLFQTSTLNMLLMKAIVVITIGITLASGRKKGNGIISTTSTFGKFHFMLFSCLCQVKRTDFVSCFSVIVIVKALSAMFIFLLWTRTQTLLISL